MRTQSLFWHLYPSYLLIALVPLLILSVVGVRSFTGLFHESAVHGLEARLHILEKDARAAFADPGERDAFCESLKKKTDMRITLLDPAGKVLWDSHEDARLMDNHADRPEFRDAMAGKNAGHIRYSDTLQQNMLYVAGALREGDKMLGVLRLATPMTVLDKSLHATYQRLFLACLAIAVVAAFLGYVVARQISSPLALLTAGARQFASGNLGFRLPEQSYQEVRALAESMNAMAGQLSERIQAMLQQRNEQEAVLASMVEGVLAVDRKENLISVNQAAARLFGLEAEHVAGQSIHSVIRNPDLQRFLSDVLAQQKSLEGEIVIMEDSARYLQAHGSVLRDMRGQSIGAVVVLNEVTRLKKLEAMRRDFVANVSHELRTPITSIKGFVETLLDGAIANPEELRRFLEIVARHADRLNAIIEDLLSLSRIEQEAEKSEIHLEAAALRPVLAGAIQVCEQKAADKNIAIDLQCPEDITARINQPLLEQALVNLIDNAIKYSTHGESIQVTGFNPCDSADTVLVQVQDHGAGIAKEHLPRLFERFYRADKARSRKLGGTGLGLAIVKHIVLAHHGKITVESTLGEGSTFTIYLPKV